MDITNASGTPLAVAGVVVMSVGALALIALIFRGKIHF